MTHCTFNDEEHQQNMLVTLYTVVPWPASFFSLVKLIKQKIILTDNSL